jgi:hypothetical protein
MTSQDTTKFVFEALSILKALPSSLPAKKSLIHIRVKRLEICGEPQNKFNIVSIHHPPDENQ